MEIPWTEYIGSKGEMFHTDFKYENITYQGSISLKEAYWRLEVIKELDKENNISVYRRLNKNFTIDEVQEKASKDFGKLFVSIMPS